jgi:hypothetical protein
MTLPDYVRSFDPEDHERVFHFLAIFARYECALKRSGFVRRGSHGEADADWNTYADHISTRLARLTSPRYVTARDRILEKPPLRECLYNGRIHLLPNPRRKGETDARYLLRVVRDVRNNLFHGGKFQNDESAELARDRLLIDSAIIVLEASADVDDSIRGFFYG